MFQRYLFVILMTNADMVFKNDDIVTVDSSKPTAQAIAIDDGKIVFVGSNDKISVVINLFIFQN